ncbi:hypothetical protein LSUE1_G006850 [Lachnellula suecica]|uniref:Uncharacterized protein n=1 Tax=Lachnellula suecica TaxID=602035 RepID=A0A8T9C736_9HELO|nr:hypothetical protein LSUE1_G006850 [Lachnellula suecica]
MGNISMCRKSPLENSGSDPGTPQQLFPETCAGLTMLDRMWAAYIITFYVGTDIYGRLVLDPLEHAAAEAMQALPAPDLEEMEEPFFIPFPGTTKELKKRPYRGSDPEWQEFVKFSKDKPLQAKVRDDLVQFVKRVAERHPVITVKCGKNLKQRRSWIDVDFPQFGPPEFERSGIEIADDAISWVSQPVDSLTVFRLRQILWPSAIVQSFWNFTKVLVVDDTKRIAGMLGIRSNTAPSTIGALLSKQQEMMRGSFPNKDGPPPALPGDATGNAKAGFIKISTPAKPTLKQQNPDKSPEEKDTEVNPATSMAVALHQHFGRALLALRTKLKQTWRPAPNYPPRGSILISGMVELEAPKAFLVFDVKAAWDPQTKAFDQRSMFLQLRRFQWKSQGPVRV